VLNDSGRSGIFELVERDAWLDFFAAAPDDCAQALEISSERLGDWGCWQVVKWLSWSSTAPCA
jgi:hypothetical protein